MACPSSKTKGQIMPEFLAILAAYYGCHATVALRPLSDEETYMCTKATASVQVYFLTKVELAMMASSPASKREMGQMIALKRFKAWEAANPKAVSILKAKTTGKKETLI
jgi:hypothetical protein